MKIADARTFVVANPPPSYGGRYFVFVKLVTDDGIEGIGEAYVATFGPHTVARMIEDVCDRHVIGADPFRIEALWRDVYGRGYSHRPDISLVGVLSAVELALWDIIGKSVGRPVHDLLGGRLRERLRGYTYLYPEPGDRADVYNDPDLAAERAAEYVARGFTALKFDPAGRFATGDPRQPSGEVLERCERYVRTVREAVGPGCDLLFGTHGQFTAAGAIRLARRLEAYDPLWFEEPTPPEAPEEMARVARATSIPIATGERLTTKHEFARVLEAGAAAILQPNLGRVGGLLEGKKIAALAEVHYAQIAPHLYCGPVVGAANAQLAACSPNFLVLEGIADWGGFHAELLRTPLQFEDGHLLVPTRAGPRRRARRGGRPPPSLRRRRAAPRAGLRRGRRERPGRDVNVGFVGLGQLGRHLAASLLRAGFPLTVHDRSPDAAAGLATLGARVAGSPREVALASDAVLTCLPSPAAVTEVVTGPDGLLEGLRPGCTWIDSSTNDLHELRRLAGLLAAAGIETLEAPVTGGVHLAASGEITVIVGGDEAVANAHWALFEAMGRSVFRVGPLGAASALKVITNLLAFIHLVADGEALMLARRAGLDLGQAWEVIRASSGTSFVHETEGQLILNGSYDIGFTMDLALKDLGLARGLARDGGVPLELGGLVEGIFERARATYGGAAASTMVVRLLEDAVGSDLRAPGFPAALSVE